QTGKKSSPILSRVKPVNRFLPVTQIIKANRRDVCLGKIKGVPRLFHFLDRRDKLRFGFRGQTLAKLADLDSWPFGIVVRRDVNVDMSRVGDGLATGDAGATNHEEKGNGNALHKPNEPQARSSLRTAQLPVHSSTSGRSSLRNSVHAIAT